MQNLHKKLFIIRDKKAVVLPVEIKQKQTKDNGSLIY